MNAKIKYKLNIKNALRRWQQWGIVSGIAVSFYKNKVGAINYMERE